MADDPARVSRLESLVRRPLVFRPFTVETNWEVPDRLSAAVSLRRIDEREETRLLLPERSRIPVTVETIRELPVSDSRLLSRDSRCVLLLLLLVVGLKLFTLVTNSDDPDSDSTADILL